MKQNVSSILITGGTGYIGQNVAKTFVEKGFDVHIIARSTSNIKCFENFPQIHMHHYDGNSITLNNIVKKIKPTTIFHLAAITFFDHSNHIPELIAANIQFGVYLLEAMKKNSCNHLVNTGTFTQHYNSMDYNPQSLYDATKQAFQTIIDYFVGAYNFKVITLKLVDVYGPNDSRKKILNLLTDAVISGKTLDISPAQQLLDLIYIDDVVNAYEIAHFNLQQTNTPFHNKYFAATGHFISLKEVIELYSSLLGKEIPVNCGGRSYREREIMIPQIGEFLPEWQPKTSLKEGLQRLIFSNRSLAEESMK
jgi:nucleoside-diphosphate-sugar epimerase